MVEHNSKDENYTEAQIYLRPIIHTKKGCSQFYRVLTQKSGIPKGVAKWEIPILIIWKLNALCLALQTKLQKLQSLNLAQVCYIASE